MTDRYAAERRRMVERQLARRGIRDERVLAAMERVPRDAFVPADLAEFAYDDNPLPIAEGQTISQPYIVALMAEAAQIGPERPRPGGRHRLRLCGGRLRRARRRGRHHRAAQGAGGRRARGAAAARLQQRRRRRRGRHARRARAGPVRRHPGRRRGARAAGFAEAPAGGRRTPGHPGQRQLAPGAAGHHAARRRLRGGGSRRRSASCR